MNSNDSEFDPDEDRISNFWEFRFNTNPTNPDTDGDGLLDGEEFHDYKSNGTNPDTDGDGYLDGEDDYPIDPSKWKKDKDKSAGFIPGFETLLLLFVIIIVIIKERKLF